jgi:hypothetical protein
MIHEKDNSMLSSSNRHFINALMSCEKIKETLIIENDLIVITSLRFIY